MRCLPILAAYLFTSSVDAVTQPQVDSTNSNDQIPDLESSYQDSNLAYSASLTPPSPGTQSLSDPVTAFQLTQKDRSTPNEQLSPSDAQPLSVAQAPALSKAPSFPDTSPPAPKADTFLLADYSCPWNRWLLCCAGIVFPGPDPENDGGFVGDCHLCKITSIFRLYFFPLHQSFIWKALLYRLVYSSIDPFTIFTIS